MSLTNPMGDHVLTEPQAMRALAHPVRLAVLGHLQRHGPSTATALAPHVGASPSVTSWHLRHLEKHGLVRDHAGGTDRRQRWWEATAPGFRIGLPDGAEGRTAARVLSNQMTGQAVETVLAWVSEQEPRLDDRWSELSGTSSTGVVVTADELERLEDEMEALLVPYVQRRGDDPPDGRSVRVVRHFLVETDEQ